MATDKPRFSLTLEPEMLDRVLDYKKENGLSTKSKAVQKLLEIAISDIQAEQGIAVVLSRDENQLVEDYRELNKEGKEYIRQTMAMAKRSYVRKTDRVSDMEAAN